MSDPIALLTAPADLDLIADVAARLDLREPNARAIRSIAHRLNEHEAKGGDDFFEGVVDAATGLGKSYVIAGAIDYFAKLGGRNFAIIAPGTTILNKTINQFTPGHAKSLLGGMDVTPTVVTADNFTTPAISGSFEDERDVKLYIFTVQSLLGVGRGESAQRRKTRTFQEELGEEFYEYLGNVPDLIVFADEHHCYGGPKFSDAVRGLDPLALIGLTATPDEKALKKSGTPIIFRYPLAAAINDKYVKTPVIVGRKDDAVDEKMQLRDGGVLLQAKEKRLNAYCAENPEAKPVHPVMLVSCESIEHAKETAAFLRSEEFFGGAFAGDGVVLEVNSKEKTEEALAALDAVEDAESPTRIIVQIGMLKEGWDVKNVYVIVSLRASISQVLTEQTLGRGLRLPFGQYVDDPAYQYLNELEVVAHERYRDLLENTGKLTETFIDHETVFEVPDEDNDDEHDDGHVDEHDDEDFEANAEEKAGADGADVIEEEEVTVLVTEAGDEDDAAEGATPAVTVGDTESRLEHAEEEAAQDTPLTPVQDFADLQIPKVRGEAVGGPAVDQITDLNPFREVGRKAAIDPEKYLPRTRLVGSVDDDARTATVIATDADEQFEAAEVTITPDEGRDVVIDRVMRSGVVPRKPGAREDVGELLDAVLEGAGEKADVLLTQLSARVGDGLARAIGDQLKVLAGAGTSVTYKVTGTETFSSPTRIERSPASPDRKGGKFIKGRAYTGWKTGLFTQAWFDSSPERDMANILDDEPTIKVWVRLHLKDLPILWSGAGREYNPDFLAIDDSGDYWVIEVKDDRNMSSAEVQAKRKAALLWVKAVNKGGSHGKWHYMLASETDLESAKGSWAALVKATSA